MSHYGRFLLTVGAFAIMALSPAVAAEQAAATPNMDAIAARVTQDLAAELALTGPQVGEVQKAMTEDLTRRAEIFSKHPKGGVAETLVNVRQELEASDAKTKTALTKVLKPEQLAKFEAWQQKSRTQAGGEMTVFRLTPKLNISPDQREKLIPIFAENIKKRRELMQTREPNAEKEAQDAFKAKSAKLENELDEQLKPVLSSDQMAAYRTERDERRKEIRGRMKQASGS